MQIWNWIQVGWNAALCSVSMYIEPNDLKKSVATHWLVHVLSDRKTHPVIWSADVVTWPTAHWHIWAVRLSLWGIKSGHVVYIQCNCVRRELKLWNVCSSLPRVSILANLRAAFSIHFTPSSDAPQQNLVSSFCHAGTERGVERETRWEVKKREGLTFILKANKHASAPLFESPWKQKNIP